MTTCCFLGQVSRPEEKLAIRRAVDRADVSGVRYPEMWATRNLQFLPGPADLFEEKGLIEEKELAWSREDDRSREKDWWKERNR